MSQQNQVVEFWTPVARMVKGDLFEMRTTDADGNPLVTKNGPNAGQPRSECYFAMAIRKDDPAFPAFWAVLAGEAQRGFPHLFGADGKCIKPDFAWKMTDGDSIIPNARGNRPCDQEGYPGHWVFHFTTGIAPKVYHVGKETQGLEITDSNIARRGYYYQVFGTVRSNDDARKPGLYLNPRFVRLCGYGDEIVSGPDVASAMKTAPAPTLPPGASALPIGGATTPAAPAAPAVAAVPALVPGAAVTPAAPATPATVPGQVPPPARDFLTPPVAPVAPAPVKQMTAKAGGATYEQFVAQGWTDAQMIEQGYLVA